ncbi:DUF397 domain-containing protein [Streptomyces sp. NPDC050421]|uniref:DUF397 domain-containing protein n=1 Tax=Streptomyces sp. NPDC050421 TaxID=3365613 RepID=UPI00378D55E4
MFGVQYDPTELVWRTSSYSSGNGQCVEVADAQGAVPVRDSKDATGPVVSFSGHSWSAFIADVKAARGSR